MPTLLCAADGEGQGQLSHLPQVSRGREAFFLTHATTWPGGGGVSPALMPSRPAHLYPVNRSAVLRCPDKVQNLLSHVQLPVEAVPVLPR